MDKLSENLFNFKRIKKRLPDYLRDRVIITEMKGKPNIFTFRSTASYIIHKFKRLPKPEASEIQKFRVIETAAKLVKSDIKAVETRKDIYPSAEYI